MRVKMAAAVATAKLLDPVEVDWALGHAAVNVRFGEHDLAGLLDYGPPAPDRCTAPGRAAP